MELIKDLGKKKVNNRNRRFGLFKCTYCDREVEKRMDSGKVYQSCGCMSTKEVFKKFEEWKCTECGILKPLTEYYQNETGHRRECKLCVKDKQLQRKFGVSLKWYTKKLKEQGNVCDICKKHLQSDRYKHFAIDHDHDTGEVRGLLCNNCNTALGLVKEDERTINNMNKYLKKYK
jgi:hypothetical protein